MTPLARVRDAYLGLVTSEGKTDTMMRTTSVSLTLLPAFKKHFELCLAVEHGAARFPIHRLDLVVPNLERGPLGHVVDDLRGALILALGDRDPHVLQRVGDLAEQVAPGSSARRKRSGWRGSIDRYTAVI